MLGKTFRTAMRTLLIVAPAVAIVMAAPATVSAAAPTTSSPAATQGGTKICVPVHLIGKGNGVPSDDKLIHTTGTVLLLGFPVATTNATFKPSPPPANGILSFSGPIDFTTIIGGLQFTAEVQGGVNVTTGAFEATSTSVTGTGPLDGISGSLTFKGIQNTDGTFTETIAGRLCSPVRR